MGEVYKLTCKCGYTKELCLGEGLAASNINVVNSVFSEEKLKKFNIYYLNNEVNSFYIENVVALCDTCNEIMSISILNFNINNNTKFQIINRCNLCSNDSLTIADRPNCPICGDKMIKKEIGQWD